MKNSIKYFLLSIMVVLGLFALSSRQVNASDVDGGQVSVPGAITFESESKGTTSSGETNIKKPDNGKEYFGVLPKTGENRSKLAIIGLLFVLFGVIIYFRKNEVTKK